MAAYAALVSLMNNAEHILNHPRLSTSFDQEQIRTLQEKTGFLLDFIERYNSEEDLESKIAYAAHAAEDVIESRVVDRIRSGSTEESRIWSLDLQSVIEDMDSIIETVMQVKQERGFKGQQPTNSMLSASSRPLTTGKTTMVGFDDESLQLSDVLTGHQSDRQIISIVGMAGVGKTTLARNVYELYVRCFDVHAWVTVSQEYNVREILLKILLEILSRLGESCLGMGEKTEAQLREKLFKTLFGRKYLVVLDDMWSVDIWDRINSFLPDNGNSSRVIVTTRLSSVSNYVGSFELKLNSLDGGNSWNLFCQRAFPQESCPLELEEIGRRIVSNCRGLPLSIVVIGGLLGKSSRTQGYWEYVEHHISSIVLNSEEERQCLDVISLSYNHLPACLKPCFLYMGIFPEDHEISVSRLIKLWVAEGFLKPNNDQSLEDIAKGYIENLVDRNLILVCGLGSNGKLKTCKVHDLLREFCIREVEKEKFLYVMRMLDTPRDINGERRIIIHGSTIENFALESMSLARSVICQSPTLLSSESRLLRVLTEAYTNSLDATFRQVNLRLLAYESIHGWIYSYKLPLSISLLWNVQTLMIDKSIDEVVAPPEIWEMRQLRHVQFRKICLPDPLPGDQQDDSVLQSLQTLGTISDFKCSEEVCRRMPNIRKLCVFYDDFSGEGERSSWYSLYNVGHFNKLESLYYCFYTVPNRDDLLQNLRFPSSLKRLTLKDCELRWEDLKIVGSLPHLEVLKLKNHSVRGARWYPVDGEFLRLKFLEIDSCYLIYWNADTSHFPVLDKLVLRGLHKLDEIPSGIGETTTLICVVECSISAAISAIGILDEQESYGNNDLQVRVEFRNKIDVVEFQEKVKLENFTTQNFQIVGV